MYPRTEYEMTQDDLNALLDAMKPVPMIMLQCGKPPSQQKNANRAWETLGKKMGFDSYTVRPASGKGDRFFTAVPSETESQRAERLAKQAEEKRQADIAALTAEIQERRQKLDALRSMGGSNE